MADRVSATITIGGNLPRRHLPEMLTIIADEGLSTGWDGEPFAVAQLSADAPLMLMAHEVAWGRFEELESFCVVHRLEFARWSGGYPAQWGPERVVFSGDSEPQSYAASDDDEVLVGRETAERLGSIEAIRVWFDMAEHSIPPLRVTD